MVKRAKSKMEIISSVSPSGNAMTFTVDPKDRISGLLSYISESHDDWGDSMWCLCARVFIDKKSKGIFIKHAMFSLRDPLSVFDGDLQDFYNFCPNHTALTEFRNRFFGPDWTVFVMDKEALIQHIYEELVKEDVDKLVDSTVHMEVAKVLIGTIKDVTTEELMAAMVN